MPSILKFSPIVPRVFQNGVRSFELKGEQVSALPQYNSEMSPTKRTSAVRTVARMLGLKSNELKRYAVQRVESTDSPPVAQVIVAPQGMTKTAFARVRDALFDVFRSAKGKKSGNPEFSIAA